MLALSQRSNREAELPGITRAREITVINLQGNDRNLFRRMARDMANRYLRLMPQFQNRKLDNFSVLLNEVPELLSATKTKDLGAKVDSAQRRLGISRKRRTELEDQIQAFKLAGRDAQIDEQHAMLLIMMHRYANRVPQESLFGADNDPEPSRPVVGRQRRLPGGPYSPFPSVRQAVFLRNGRSLRCFFRKRRAIPSSGCEVGRCPSCTDGSATSGDYRWDPKSNMSFSPNDHMTSSRVGIFRIMTEC